MGLAASAPTALTVCSEAPPMLAEVYRPAPGTDEDHLGPVIASAVHEVREGEYDKPVTIVVP